MTGFTLGAGESLHRSWHEERILRVLQQRLSNGHYDFVFVLLPSEQTHGEHKAASILAFEAIELLPYMTLKPQIRYSCLNCSKLLQRIGAIRGSGQYVSGCEIMELPRMGG